MSNLIYGLKYPEKRQRNDNEEINNDENEVKNLTTIEQINSTFNLTQWWACLILQPKGVVICHDCPKDVSQFPSVRPHRLCGRGMGVPRQLDGG